MENATEIVSNQLKYTEKTKKYLGQKNWTYVDKLKMLPIEELRLLLENKWKNFKIENKLQADGYSQKEVAELLNVKVHVVHKFLRENGCGSRVIDSDIKDLCITLLIQNEFKTLMPDTVKLLKKYLEGKAIKEGVTNKFKELYSLSNSELIVRVKGIKIKEN